MKLRGPILSGFIVLLSAIQQAHSAGPSMTFAQAQGKYLFWKPMCEKNFESSVEDRIRACKSMIAAGPSGWPDKQKIYNDSLPMGEYTFYTAHLFLGKAYNDTGHYDEAVAILSTSINIVTNWTAYAQHANHNLATAYGWRALSYYGLGDYEKAIADLDSQEKADREAHKSTENLRGDIEMARKNYSLALQYFEDARSAPNPPPGLAEKIVLARRMRDNPQLPSPVPPPRPPAPAPGVPDSESPACKMYPNLC